MQLIHIVNTVETDSFQFMTVADVSAPVMGARAGLNGGARGALFDQCRTITLSARSKFQPRNDWALAMSSVKESKAAGILTRFSIKTILLTGLGCLALFLAVALGRQAASAWRDHSSATMAKEFDIGATQFINGLYDVLLERLDTNNALQAAEPASGAAISKIDAYRKSVKAQFDVGLEILRQQDFPNKAALLQELTGALQRANAARAQADAAIKMPLAQRDENLRKTFVPTITASVNAALKVWFAALYSSAKNDADLMRLASVKEIGWRMRDHSGQERAVVAGAIASAGQIPADRNIFILEQRARVALLWGQLQNLTAESNTHPAIIQAMKSSQEKYFRDFIALSDNMRKVSDAKGAYPMTAAQWVETTNPQIGALLEVLYAGSKASEAVTNATLNRAFADLAMTLVFSFVGFAATVFCLWAVVMNVTRPITALVPELKKLSEGDFNVSLPAGRKDEIGQIADALEVIVDRFGATISTIKTASNEVTNAAVEISASTTDLSQRTEEQAASLEETSASMEEMSATVRKNAENARHANELATGTRDVADRGGKVVAEAVEAMAKIESSSGKISDIITVIDEIARQTNLLALNAAVEAARAGEAGRGFAVVASEVRSLAQRSSQAAKDIKDLITNSTGQVKQGVDLVNRAGTALNEIVVSIRKVSEVVADIANASNEQSTGLEQINKALAQMDEVTQQNSALVEENAATAKTLENQARAISEDKRVAAFRLRDAGGMEAARATGVGAAVRTPVAASPMRKPVTPKPAPAPAPRRAAAGGGVQGALALKSDAEWKEF
jgi:methyl-accepting chemotaxis protein